MHVCIRRQTLVILVDYFLVFFVCKSISYTPILFRFRVLEEATGSEKVRMGTQQIVVIVERPWTLSLCVDVNGDGRKILSGRVMRQTCENTNRLTLAVIGLLSVTRYRFRLFLQYAPRNHRPLFEGAPSISKVTKG